MHNEFKEAGTGWPPIQMGRWDWREGGREREWGHARAAPEIIEHCMLQFALLLLLLEKFISTALCHLHAVPLNVTITAADCLFELQSINAQNNVDELI